MSSEQKTLFDLEAGRAARDEALDRFESMHFVEEARQTAFAICQRQTFVTSDDLHEAFPEVPSGNYFGAILRAPYFVKCGEVNSKRPEAKARTIHKWAIGPAWRKYI